MGSSDNNNNNNNNQTKQHESLAETLASNNVFFNTEDQPKASNDTGTTTVAFADEKPNVKDRAVTKLNKMEQPMAETLNDLNSSTPIVAGLDKDNDSNMTPIREEAQKDAFADSQALHDKQAAKLLHSHQPMNDTLGQTNKYMGDTKE